MIRTRLYRATGVHLTNKETIKNYFHRLDVAGRADHTFLIKIITEVCEELDELQKPKTKAKTK